MTIRLVTCECCRFEVPDHDIRGEHCCSECWNSVPSLNRLIAGPRDLFSDTSWEYRTELAEQRRLEDEARDYYDRLDPPASEQFRGPY